MGVPAHRCAGGEKRRSSEACSGSPLRRWGEAAEFGGVFRRNREPGWSGRGEKAQRRLIGRHKLATGAKIGRQLPAGRRSAG